MKKSILLDNGDIRLIDGNIVLTDGEEKVRQLIQNTLSIRKGEWFYNTNTGLDHGEIFKKRPDIDTFRGDIIESLNNLKEVEKVNKVDIEYNKLDREATVYLNVTYDLGNISMEVTI